MKKAIAYYRHSAKDKQENSVEIQQEHIKNFCKEHNIDLLHEEADRGYSGLSSDRPWFSSLFDNWVLNEDSENFDYILVYDISRWWRFQNPDESGYYEYLCRRYWIKVVYVSKWFEQEENSLLFHLQSSIERYSVAEYSRWLSIKVHNGCVKVVRQGFSAGGRAPFWYVRILLNENKEPVRILQKGEHKQISNQRVTFAVSNKEASKVVRNIFEWFGKEGLSIHQIVYLLNAKKILSPGGKEWSYDKVLRILKNPAYIGTRIYNKTSNKLKKWYKKNNQKDWIIVKKSFPALIKQKDFYKVQKLLKLYRNNALDGKKKSFLLKYNSRRKDCYLFHRPQWKYFTHFFAIWVYKKTLSCFKIPEKEFRIWNICRITDNKYQIWKTYNLTTWK